MVISQSELGITKVETKCSPWRVHANYLTFKGILEIYTKTAILNYPNFRLNWCLPSHLQFVLLSASRDCCVGGIQRQREAFVVTSLNFCYSPFRSWIVIWVQNLNLGYIPYAIFSVCFSIKVPMDVFCHSLVWYRVIKAVTTATVIWICAVSCVSCWGYIGHRLKRKLLGIIYASISNPS